VLSARLTLSKHASPAHVLKGSTVTFTLHVANITEVSALKVKVCDTLPTGLTVASAPGFSVRGRRLCTSPSSLGVLASKTLRFTALVGSGAPSRVTNIATAAASNAATVRARATINVVIPPPPGRG
jgi:uncharacterized repeat protein (TIGR01451 family)